MSAAASPSRAAKAYRVTHVNTGRLVFSGPLHEFDQWWHLNAHRVESFCVQSDTRTEKLVSVTTLVSIERFEAVPGPWPTHADGRPMTLGEMTPGQRRAHSKAATRRVAAELQRYAPAIAKVLRDFDAEQGAAS